MSGDERAAPPTPSHDDGRRPSFFRRLIRLFTPWGVKHALQLKFQELNDLLQALGSRLDRVETRLDAIEAGIRDLQADAADLRDRRLGPFERRMDAIEATAGELSTETTRLRDGVIPATIQRGNALVDRLAEELEETSSLVERMLRSEPLPVGGGAVDEKRLAGALADVHPRLLEAFRGPEEEIGHRLDGYLDDLRARSPVLDLGCGRGELLLMLREAGVEAAGIEGDPALTEAAVRRGLRVTEGDVLDALRTLGADSYGAVTAIHLLEHLRQSELAALVAEVRRVLRPGGLFLAECPNPHALRVGGALFWQDPTHVRPLLPETLELFLRAGGFEITRREVLHPFPEDQLFASCRTTDDLSDDDVAELATRVDRISDRLDEILNAPRDFAVWATVPD
jgi:SAM-dependent methyltransferase